MAILITGGAGFIGSHFIELMLRESDESLVCLDNFNSYYDPALKRSNVAGFEQESRVCVLHGDFCDLDSNRRLFAQHDIDRVVHLGAYAGVRASVDAGR